MHAARKKVSVLPEKAGIHLSDLLSVIGIFFQTGPGYGYGGYSMSTSMILNLLQLGTLLRHGTMHGDTMICSQ